MMEKFDFLIGNWNLKYDIPKSSYGDASKGTGNGSFKRALSNKYVYFDYSASIENNIFKARAIFAFDKKLNLYRLWWFENSGNFSNASGKFINDDTLYLIWHDSLLIQTFNKINPDKIVLRMENPDSGGKNELIMEVTFTRKQN